MVTKGIQELEDYRAGTGEDLPAGAPRAVLVEQETRDDYLCMDVGTPEEFQNRASGAAGAWPRQVGMELDAGALKLVLAAQGGGDFDALVLMGPDGLLVCSGNGGNAVVIRNGEVVHTGLEASDIDALRGEIGLPPCNPAPQATTPASR